MFRDIQMIRAIMYLAMVLVIGVACFNIVSTLVMAVKDKSSDIAVLRTLGAKDRFDPRHISSGMVYWLEWWVASVWRCGWCRIASLQLTNIIEDYRKS
jgi:lipoprotein-releasing system permease protein